VSHPFSGADSACHLPPLLSVLDYNSVCFSVLWAVWFWMLLSGSGEQLCDALPVLICGMTYCPPTLSLHYLSCVFLLSIQLWV
jgi:hypothetical protein